MAPDRCSAVCEFKWSNSLLVQPLTPHELQNTGDGVVQRRVGNAAGAMTRLLIVSGIVSLELHAGDVVDRIDQKVEKWKQQISPGAATNDFRNELAQCEMVETPASLFGDAIRHITHRCKIVPHNVKGFANSIREIANGNDVGCHN